MATEVSVHGVTKTKKVTQNGENAYLAIKNPKSFQGPRAGPGPQPIGAHFVHVTLLHGVGKNGQKIIGPRSHLFCGLSDQTNDIFPFKMGHLARGLIRQYILPLKTDHLVRRTTEQV